MPFLAESDPTVKIVIGVVFAGIWVLSQVASAWSERRKKQQQQVPPPPRPARAPRGVPTGGPMPQRAPQQPRPPHSVAPPPLRRGSVPQSVPQSVPRRQAPARTVPSAQQTATTIQENAAAVKADAHVYRTKQSSPSEGPTRRDRLKSILRPRNLRKEFILTEILQPPISVRPVADR